MAVSDRSNNLMYADILAGVILGLDARDGARTEIYATREDQRPYYRINYACGKLFAASNDSIFISGADGHEIISSYQYAPLAVTLRIALFVGGILDVLVFIAVLSALAPHVLRKKIDASLKIILITGCSIAFGGLIASFLIINEMSRQYNNKMFSDLENISRLVTGIVDTETLLSITSPADYDTNRYRSFKESLTAQWVFACSPISTPM
jgi:hypothetical protein